MVLLSFPAVESLNPLLYEDFASLALRFGPFFFSLFFAIFFIPWAQKKYRIITEQVDPPPSERQRKIYAWYFIASGIFCVALIIICVIWWIFLQGSPKIISGVIEDVDDYVEISSPALYFRVVRYENTISKNYHFVYTYKSEALPDSFRLNITKMGSVEESPSYIKCREISKNQKFQYKYNGEHDKHKVEALAENKNSIPLSFLNSAYAMYLEAPYSKKLSKSHMLRSGNLKQEYIQELPCKLKIIARLQNERTPVGEKIMIIDTLLSIEDNDSIIACLRYVSSKEPFLITLMDLSRHSDSELAYKVSRLIEPYPVEEILYEIISHENEKIKQDEILSRLPAQTVQEILELHHENGEGNLQLNYEADYQAEYLRQKLLYPTGSRKGDRYYVKASWNANDQSAFDCLSQLFKRELISDRTLEEEKAIMRKMGTERYVYWYSKEWAMRIAEEIEACGGNAEFVSF